MTTPPQRRVEALADGLSTYLDVRSARKLGHRPRQLPLLYIELLTKCNLRCLHCGFASDYPTREKLLDTNQWKRVLDEAQQLGTRIVSFSGGEPFLRPDIYELLHHANANGISLHVNSNGTRLDENAARSLAKLKRCTVVLSLDHPVPAENDAIRGQGTFDAVRKAARLLRSHAPHIHVGLNTVIGPFNMGHWESIVDLGAVWNVQSVKFLPAQDNLNHSWREKSLDAHYVFTPDQIPAVRHELARVKRRAGEYRLSTNSRTFFRLVEKFINGQPALPCYAGYLIGNIDPYGYLFPCYDLTNAAPNVLDGGLIAAWGGAKMQTLAEKVKTCAAKCLCSGYAEPSARADPMMMLREPRQILDDIRFYFLR